MSRADLTALADTMRRTVLERAKAAGVGHIGSALSIVDLLAVVYGRVLRVADVDDPDRDRLVLSKGHAALALYAALHATGRLDAGELESYCTDGGSLGVHPETRVPGVDFATGSLGLGLSFGVGAALAARLEGSQRRVYVLLSDAELNEGSTWEAATFAAHHELGNLVAIVDLNGQQALGFTKDVLDPGITSDRLRAFGWNALDVDGHDREALSAALTRETTGPNAVVAHTTFGRGVSFMQSRIAWHYMPMTDEEFSLALGELETA